MYRNVLAAGGEVRHMVCHGTVSREFLRAARRAEADLVVVGAHRPGLEDDLLGPDSARVVSHAACSVLVVRR